MHRLRLPLHFLAAVLVLAVLASLWESYRNLAAIIALGHPVPWPARLDTVRHDLLGFAPAMALLGGAALLCSLPVAAGIARWLPAWRSALLVTAGVAGIAVMLLLMRASLGIMVVSSARDAVGFAGLCLCGGIAAASFVWLRRRAAKPAD